jgi:hypothetical protein
MMLAAAPFVFALAAAQAATATVGATLDTGGGLVTVDGVEFSDRFPPKCTTPSRNCSEAKPGYRILVVWLKAKGDDSKLSQVLMNLETATVAADNGSKTKNFSGGMAEGRYFVAFTPPIADKNFTLHWGKNAPLSLGK